MALSALVSLRRHPVVIIASIILIAAVIWGFWPQPVLVETVAVQRAPMQVTIEEEGRTRVIHRYVVSAPVDGVACRTHLDVGDPVEQAQMLYGITPLASRVLDSRSRAQAQAKVAAAESALRAAEQQAQAAVEAAELTNTELERQRSLLDRQLVSVEVVDRAQTQANTAKAAKRSAEFMVDVARYDLEAARTALEYSAASDKDMATEIVPVTSPITGKVLKVHHECEGPVVTGQPLLEIGDPAALEVEVDVLSADAVKISEGMPVLFERWGGDFPLQGVVQRVEPVGFTKISALGVEEQRVLVISNFISPLEQWQRLGDGYRVEARFILWQQDDVLQVPASSLFRVNGGWAVFVFDHGRAQRRQVEIGQRNGLIVQILSGLDDNEAVINHPSDAIADGVRVRE